MAANRPSSTNGAAKDQNWRSEGSNQQLELGHQHRSTVYAPIAPALRSTRGSLTSPAAGIKTSKRRRVACKDCRQAKLRCDGSDGGSWPCTRCRDLSLECEVDLEYKRFNKKIKLNELSEQVEQLRSAVRSNGAAPMTTATAITSQSPGSSVSMHSVDPLVHSPQSARRESILDTATQIDRSTGRVQNPNSTIRPGFAQRTSQAPFAHEPESHPVTESSSRSLEHIFLSQERVNQLFQTYFECYHPFFGILEPSVSPDVIHERSPLLFWTIILIAARRDEDDPTLLSGLSPCVKKLLWSAIVEPPYSLLLIQAMTLICMWPFPTSSQFTDTSFIIAGVARNAAVHIGLHRPEILQDFSRVKCRLGQQELQEAVKVWAGVYLAAETITNCLGYSTTFMSDWTIERACGVENTYALPRNLYHFLLIQRFCNRVHRTMGGNERSPTGHPVEGESSILMKLLEHDYEDLERQLGDSLPSQTEILLLCACFQLRTYYLFEAPASDFRKEALIKAYATSLDLISKFNIADTNSNFSRFAPNYISHMLGMAAILVMKIVSSSYSQYVDVEGGRRAFNTVLSILRKCSVEDNDLKGRMSKILAQLWGVHLSDRARRDQPPSLTIKSRFCASILHDSLWLWRERFGGPGYTAAPQLPSGPKSTSSRSTTASDPRLETSMAFSSSIPIPLPESVNTDVGTRATQDYLDPSDNLAYGSNEPPAEYLHYDYNMALEEHDWMWHFGFASVLPGNLDFYPTTSALSLVAQDHVQQ